MILSAELTNILSAFSQNGIAAMPLKGTVLAEVLYGNPALRPMVDMDILVHPEEISLAQSLLAKLGYKQVDPWPYWDHPFHEAPYYKKGSFTLFLELHWALDDRKLVAVPEQDIWRRAQPIELQGFSTMTLSPEDNLLFLANHLAKQDIDLLKSLGDIAELIKKYNEALDWDYITESAHSWQIEAAVYYSLRRARDLLGAPVPPAPLKALKPRAWRWWLLDLMVSQETFVSPIRGNKLRSETLALTRSLTMRYPRQMLAVLSKHRGPRKKAAWLRTAIWVMVAFSANLVRYWARVITR